MRVVWFLPVDHFDYNGMSASVWIRALQLVPYLEELGVRSFFNDESVEADISIFVRRQDESAAEIAKRQRRREQKVVFDLCVNYFDPSAALAMPDPVTDRHIRQCRKMLEFADAVTCASANIAARARDYHDKVVYLPDSIDRSHFRVRKDVEDFHRRRLILAWSGVAAKAAELEPYLLDHRASRFDVYLVAERIPPLFYKRMLRNPLGTRFSRWRYEDFPQQILRGDICLAPRQVNTPYNRGHSFFKIGVFLAEGVPVVAGPVPSYGELLQGLPCGAICRTDEEVFEVLNDLDRDRERVIRWSENAVSVMRPYETGRIAGQYLSLFREI